MDVTTVVLDYRPIIFGQWGIFSKQIGYRRIFKNLARPLADDDFRFGVSYPRLMKATREGDYHDDKCDDAEPKLNHDKTILSLFILAVATLFVFFTGTTRTGFIASNTRGQMHGYFELGRRFFLGPLSS